MTPLKIQNKPSIEIIHNHK